MVLSACALPMAGLMFLAYKYVFKPMDDEIEFYQGVSQRLQEYSEEQADLRQQDQIRRESAGAKDITPKPNNHQLPPVKK